MNPRTQTAADTLRAARALIAEKGWTRGTLARTADGTALSDALAPEADKFCLIGAVCAAAGFHHAATDAIDRLLNMVDRAIDLPDGLYGISDWNDEPGRTREEVLAMFDKAIALAETEPSRG